MAIHFSGAAERSTARWAGGTTTQLAIFPQEATYPQFNFEWRISTATVEVPQSDFTFMPGVTRHLMILEGSLHIEHTNRYSMSLDTFDKDVFDGEWPTKAQGMVTDFNLMTRNNTTGELFSMLAEPGTPLIFEKETNDEMMAWYIWSGKLKGYREMQKGDLFMATGKDDKIYNFEPEEPCRIIISKVWRTK